MDIHCSFLVITDKESRTRLLVSSNHLDGAAWGVWD
jgi:hypothetical protein